MKLISLWPLFLLVGFVASSTARATTTYESFKPTMTAGTAYTIDALKLHPTQFSVGWREIEHKRTKFDAMSTAEVIAYLQQKDVRLILKEADDLGVPVMATGLIFNLYRTLQQMGLGEEGNHALVKALENLSGVTVGAEA